jgi:hypothetical protein
MHHRTKLAITGLVAALLMAFAAQTASASRLSISRGNLWRAYWPSLRSGAFGITALDCAVTLDGSFHSATVAKVNRALIGHITLASLGRCVTGSATLLRATLPWHVQYGGFMGALPAPRPILRLIGVSYSVNTGCLARTTEETPIRAIAEPTYEGGGNGNVDTYTADSTAIIPCGALNASFAGRANVHALPGTTTRVLLRLI